MKRSFCAIGAAIVLTTTTAASADPISIVSHVRDTTAYVAVSDSSGSDSDLAVDRDDSPVIATAFASTTLSSAASNATLTTQFGNTLNWFGFGTTNSLVSTTGTGTFFARSLVGVTFDVLEPLEYAFSGNFDADVSPTGGEAPNRGVSTWGFQLDRTDRPDTVFSGIGDGPGTHLFVGLLEPGRYHMSLGTEQEVEVAGRAGFGRGTFSFTFDMTPADTAPVPEPASLVLIGTGLAGVFGWRRRAGNRSEPHS